ncbi:MAG: type II secretion system protein [Sulfuricurvum sp.]|nr:type II secretion system protein [Sulfuricurvum sp.]
MRARKAFTMIELIFVIVILGVLAAVAMPRIAASRDDARASSLAQNIMSGAGEVAAYATSKGDIVNDLTEMSNGYKTLVDTGDAVNDTTNKKVTVSFGAVSDCITVQITASGGLDTLSIAKGASGDEKCDRLQGLIDTHDYPMVLKGIHVVF